MREPSSFHFSLPALRYRNFRLFFVGQGLSLIGSWIQFAATSWLLYRLTGSSFVIGLNGVAMQAPLLLLSPIAGVFADRWNRRRTLLIVQALMAVQAAALAIAAVEASPRVWVVLSLNFFLGVLAAVEMPTRQSLIASMVDDRAHLPNAIALSGSLFHASRLTGPLAAAALIGWAGESACFAVNAVSYAAVLAALTLMRLPEGEPAPQSRAADDLRDGWVYVKTHGVVRPLLIAIIFSCFAGTPYNVLMPAFASSVLGGDHRTLGWLMAATGAGSLLGTLGLAFRREGGELAPLLRATAWMLGGAVILFGLSASIPLSMAALFAAGFAMIVQIASTNILLQGVVPDRMRGRVMSFYTVAVMGATNAGNLLAAVMADRIGPRPTVIAAGALSLVVAAGLSRRRSLPHTPPA